MNIKSPGALKNLLVRRNDRFEIQVSDQAKFELIK